MGEIRNYVRWSESFRPWIEGGIEASNQGYDYLGSPIATRLEEDWPYSWHYIQESITQFYNGDYTYSISAKAGNRFMIKLRSSRLNTYDVDTTFDLSDGTILKGDGRVEYEGDGWYRLIVTSQVINDSLFNIQIMVCNDIGNEDYQGGNDKDIYITRAMMNPGLDMEEYVMTEGWTR